MAEKIWLEFFHEFFMFLLTSLFITFFRQYTCCWGCWPSVNNSQDRYRISTIKLSKSRSYFIQHTTNHPEDFESLKFGDWSFEGLYSGLLLAHPKIVCSQDSRQWVIPSRKSHTDDKIKSLHCLFRCRLLVNFRGKWVETR